MKVLAAGAGPAGAATALLARCGVDVSLIERERLFELVLCGEIEGQVRGLQRMVEEEAYFVDILTQVASILSALEKVALIPLSRTTSSTASGRPQMTGRWSTRRWRN